MEYTNKVELDIDINLIFMEHILAKYLEYPEDGLYVKGKRFPIKDRMNIDKYNKLGILNNVPFHPLLSAVLIKDIFFNIAAANNPYRYLLHNNPLIEDYTKNAGIKFYPDYYSGEIDDYIIDTVENITVSDMEYIKIHINQISNKILDIISDKPSLIFEIDIETNRCFLLIGEDVMSYRYKEALTHKEISDEIDKESTYELH